jgi:hypothetical protein
VVGLIGSEQNIVDPLWEFGVHLLALDASSGGHGQVRVAVCIAWRTSRDLPGSVRDRTRLLGRCLFLIPRP